VQISKLFSQFSPKNVNLLYKYLIPPPTSNPQQISLESDKPIPFDIASPTHAEEIKPHFSTKTCKSHPHEILFAFKLSIESANFICLHPIYNTPFCKLTFGKFDVQISKAVDHQDMRFFLGPAGIYDLTNYPSTNCPGDYDIISINYDEIINSNKETLLLVPDAIKPTIQILTFNDDSDCPLIPKEVLNTKSQIFINIKELSLNFICEIFASRQIPYILNCLIGAFSFTDTQNSPSKQEAKTSPNTSFSQFELIIHKVALTIKPRESYKEFLQLTSDDLKIRNTKKDGHRSGIELSVIEIMSRKVMLTYCKQHNIIDPLDIMLSIETPSKIVHQDDSWVCNIAEPDMCKQINFVTKSPIKISMNASQLSLLIQCVELNIEYTDGLGEYFNFANLQGGTIKTPTKDSPSKAKSQNGTIFNFNAPSAGCSVFDWTNEWFFQGHISNISVRNESYAGGRSVLRITAKSLCVFDRNIDHDKSLMLYHKDSSERRFSVDDENDNISIFFQSEYENIRKY